MGKCWKGGRKVESEVRARGGEVESVGKSRERIREVLWGKKGGRKMRKNAKMEGWREEGKVERWKDRGDVLTSQGPIR